MSLADVQCQLLADSKQTLALGCFPSGHVHACVRQLLWGWNMSPNLGPPRILVCVSTWLRLWACASDCATEGIAVAVFGSWYLDPQLGPQHRMAVKPRCDVLCFRHVSRQHSGLHGPTHCIFCIFGIRPSMLQHPHRSITRHTRICYDASWVGAACIAYVLHLRVCRMFSSGSGLHILPLSKSVALLVLLPS